MLRSLGLAGESVESFRTILDKPGSKLMSFASSTAFLVCGATFTQRCYHANTLCQEARDVAAASSQSRLGDHDASAVFGSQMLVTQSGLQVSCSDVPFM